MKIVVLNGSPKGELSVTLQYVRYLEKKEPGHDWKIFPIAEQIGKIERDVQAFQGIIGEIERADVVIWAFPLYYFLVCSQYKRFIELIFERKATAAFDGKYAASVSTSVHFFDHTAHNYIHGICDDLQMRYVGSYSAEMYDLVHSAERRRWLGFAGHLLSAAVRGVPTERAYPPLTLSRFAYTPGPAGSAVETRGRKILILWDGQEGEGNIPAMIEVFRRNCSEPVDVASLADVDIRGGCLGCCRCGLDNICVYTGKDGFIEFFNEKVKKAEILIFAGAIRDRYLSSRWKTYFDRSFFNTHMPVLKGKQFGFLVSGPLGQLPNLRQILSAYVEVQQGGFAGIVTDEAEDSRLIDALIGGLATQAVRQAVEGYLAPPTFLGQGGRKVFRDEVWGKLRFVFQADHRYYKSHGLYDFPQKNFKVRRMNLVMTLLTKIPQFRKKFSKMIVKEMVKPLQQIVKKQ